MSAVKCPRCQGLGGNCICQILAAQTSQDVAKGAGYMSAPLKTELEVELEALKIATEALLSCPHDLMKERIVKYLIDRFNVQTP